jgi:DNA-binding XRE family transcriptional regulator
MRNLTVISFDEAMAEFNADPEFRKADRQIRPYFDLVNQVIDRRNELHLTQKDLADRLGTHQSRVSKIESADQVIRLRTIISIAEALESEVLIQLIPLSPGDYQYVGQVQTTTSNSGSIPVSFDIHVQQS